MAYWMKFENGKAGCVEAGTPKEAIRLGEKKVGSKHTSIDMLPYPADPRLVVKKYVDADGSECTFPSFCWTPEECKGRHSCPKSYSCVE